MRKRIEKATEQPKPVTPGVTKAMVRQHAYELFRDKLPDHPLTIEDWVMAEKARVPAQAWHSRVTGNRQKRQSQSVHRPAL